MKKKNNTNIIILLILTVIISDVYLQVERSKGDIWNSDWLLTRIFIVSAAVLLVFLYFYLMRIIESKRKQENFAKQLLETQEKSWKSIASELHDSLGQNLLLANNRLAEILSSDGTGKHSKDLKEIAGLLSETIEDIRNLSYSLYPHQLEKLGLTQAITSLVNKISVSSKLKFKFSADNINGLLDKEKEINFFRIIQEALNNIIKHSKADFVNLGISRGSGIITIIIEDNGKGFEAENILYGIGLNNIMERTRLLKGICRVNSVKNKGTAISISVPYRQLT